jgi:protein SCO1/2
MRPLSGRLLLIMLGVSVLLAGCALPISLPSPEARPVAAPFNGATLDPPLELPSFGLQRADGRPWASTETRDRVSLFFFGYTTCPDVCPLTLHHVAQIRKQLGSAAQRVDAYFVTVDPERDTPQRLLEYSAKFDPAIVSPTGTPTELEQARAAFGVVARKRVVAESAAGYFVDHSAGLYLVDSSSRIRVIEPYGMAEDEIAADLRRLLGMASDPAAVRPTAIPSEQPVPAVHEHGP